MTEKELIEIGFNKLAASTLVYIDVFKDEITDIVVARRIMTVDGKPLKGYMFEGLQWCEYLEEVEKVRKLMLI